MAEVLDALDRRIVSALARDGRRPYRDMARMLGVSEGTIRSRMARLQDEGLIRVTVVGSPLALGVGVVAVVLIKVGAGRVPETAKALAGYKNVRFVGTAFGSADIIIQTLHPDMRDLHRFVSEEIPASMPGVTSTETFQLAEVLKSSWTWGDWFEYLDRPGGEDGAAAEAGDGSGDRLDGADGRAAIREEAGRG